MQLNKRNCITYLQVLTGDTYRIVAFRSRIMRYNNIIILGYSILLAKKRRIKRLFGNNGYEHKTNLFEYYKVEEFVWFNIIIFGNTGSN